MVLFGCYLLTLAYVCVHKLHFLCPSLMHISQNKELLSMMFLGSFAIKPSKDPILFYMFLFFII